MTTAAQMTTALGLTSSQLTKVTEYLDRVSPKTEADGETARANTVDDFKDHIVSHYTSLVQSDLKQQVAAPAFD